MNSITFTIQNDWQVAPAMVGLYICQSMEQAVISLRGCLNSNATDDVRTVLLNVRWNSGSMIRILGSLTDAEYRFRKECSALFENLVVTVQAAWDWLFSHVKKTVRKAIACVRENILTARTILQTTRRMRI